MSQYFHTKTDQILRFATRKERCLNCSCLEKQTNSNRPLKKSKQKQQKLEQSTYTIKMFDYVRTFWHINDLDKSRKLKNTLFPSLFLYFYFY